MGHQFAAIAFTDAVKAVQAQWGSREGFAAFDQGDDYNHQLSDREVAFISARDSFYMASVSETGWPYVQHRGGPPGFMRVLDERTIGFADFRGNRQYVSVGNFQHDNRVSLFFMDYAQRTRLKVLGRVEIIDGLDMERLAMLEVDDYRAPVERGILIHVEAFDWNCPQHITPRYSESEVRSAIARLQREQRIAQVETTSAVLGNGPLEVVITGVRQLTPRIRAYELRDPQARSLPAFSPGAHLAVPVTLENGKPDVRYYSIASDSHRNDHYEIAVLREDDGRGGSAGVHAQFEIGLRLRTSLPRNLFALHDDERPSVLIAGGVGITPIKSMVHGLLARDGSFRLYYAARSQVEMAYADDLEQLAGDALQRFHSANDERINIVSILSQAPFDAVIYVCGPARLIDAVLHEAEQLGIDPARLRTERFGVDDRAPSAAFDVELRSFGKTIRVPADRSLLDAMLDAGVDVAFGCRSGVCKSCAVRVVDGEPDHRDAALSASEREQGQLICPCVSRAKGDRLVLDV